jgi:hypothetical protein
MLHLEPQVPVGTRVVVGGVLPEIRRLHVPPMDLRQACAAGGRDRRHQNPIWAQVPAVGEVHGAPRHWGAGLTEDLRHHDSDIDPVADSQ